MCGEWIACSVCETEIRVNSEEHDMVHINDDDEIICEQCRDNGYECDCPHCEEEDCNTHHCQCGQPTHPDNLCGHGIADGICCVCEECRAICIEEGIISDDEEEDEEEAYKTCCDCDYEWPTVAFWDKGKGRVAFDKENGEVCCSMCEKGVEEYIPSDDEEE